MAYIHIQVSCTFTYWLRIKYYSKTRYLYPFQTIQFRLHPCTHTASQIRESPRRKQFISHNSWNFFLPFSVSLPGRQAEREAEMRALLWSLTKKFFFPVHLLFCFLSRHPSLILILFLLLAYLHSTPVENRHALALPYAFLTNKGFCLDLASRISNNWFKWKLKYFKVYVYRCSVCGLQNLEQEYS